MPSVTTCLGKQPKQEKRVSSLYTRSFLLLAGVAAFVCWNDFAVQNGAVNQLNVAAWRSYVRVTAVSNTTTVDNALLPSRIDHGGSDEDITVERAMAQMEIVTKEIIEEEKKRLESEHTSHHHHHHHHHHEDSHSTTHSSSDNHPTKVAFGARILDERDFPPPPISPYELRWRGERLPSFASKPFFFRGYEVPKNKSVCFVHVGKAAGSAIGCALGFQLHCHDMYYPRGLLPKYTTNTLHNNINDCWDDMGYYLFTVRDPIARLKSWFAYEKPGGHSGNKWHSDRTKLYIECPFFKTLNDMAEIGLGGMQDPERLGEHSQDLNLINTCRARAHRAVPGIERFGYHAYFNYGWYYSNIRHKDSKFGVIRQEHMVKDWNSMEALLGGTDEVQHFPHKNEHSKDPGDYYLSEYATSLLCKSLCNEIQIYKTIIRRAENLLQSDVEESMQELRKSCPIQADTTDCPTHG